MYDASSRKDIRRAEKAAALAEADRINYLCSAMSIPQGRAWFYDLLERCHLFNQPPVFETNKDYFAFGERNIGTQIFDDILRNCPDDYIQMMREANERSIVRTVDNNRAHNPESVGERPDAGLDGSVEGPIIDDNLVDYGAEN